MAFKLSLPKGADLRVPLSSLARFCKAALGCAPTPLLNDTKARLVQMLAAYALASSRTGQRFMMRQPSLPINVDAYLLILHV